MQKNYTCHNLTLGDRVSLQQMSRHLNLTSSIGTKDFAFSGERQAFQQLKESRGWHQFVSNADVKAEK